MDPRQSLALRDDPDPEIEFNWLASIYIIYSTAGNVSYPGYQPPPGRKQPPWRFSAVEIIHYACLNQYQTTFDQGDSLTTVIGTSKSAGPFSATRPSMPANSLNCTDAHYGGTWWTGNLFATCHSDYYDIGPTYFYLQDPENPGDLNKSFVVKRDVLASMAQEIANDNAYYFTYDGAKHGTHKFTASSEPFFAALYADDQGGSEVDLKAMRRNAEIYFSNQAITYTNACVLTINCLIYPVISPPAGNWLTLLPLADY